MRKTALIILTAVLLSSCATTSADQGTIRVSGSARVETEPDMASFSLTVSERAETTREAQELTNLKVGIAYKVLTADYGIAEKDIATTYMNLSPEYSWIDGKQVLQGQKATQTISVRLRDLSALGDVIDSLSEISGISVGSISIDSSTRSSCLSDARMLAVQDARARAEDYARAEGLTVGAVSSITESGSDSSAYRIGNAVMKTAAPAYDMAESVSTGYYLSSIAVTSDVEVEFFIEE
ncbi:MAG: SIMPL domain-containing protein [Bullifex sp.]